MNIPSSKNSIDSVLKHITENFREKTGIHLYVNQSSVLSGGCINQALKLDTSEGTFFLKWNSNGPADLFIREAESLNELNKSNNVTLVFPKPILTKKIDHTPGYLLTTYLQTGQSDRHDEKLGQGLAQVHQIKAAQFGFAHNNYCGATLQNNTFQNEWLSFYIENRITHLISLIHKTRDWSETDMNTISTFIERVPDLLSHKPTPSLIHGDLWSGNYMYTPAGPALIDPCVSYCDREFEMGMMTLFGGFSSRVYDAYNEVYPLPSDWQERNKVYQLYHVLNHYFLFGGFYKQQAMDIMRHYK